MHVVLQRLQGELMLCQDEPWMFLALPPRSQQPRPSLWWKALTDRRYESAKHLAHWYVGLRDILLKKQSPNKDMPISVLKSFYHVFSDRPLQTKLTHAQIWSLLRNILLKD